MNHRMSIFIAALSAAALLATPAWGQSARLKMDLDHLAKDAVQSVVVNMNLALLRLAAKFLSDKDADEARVKKLIGGLESLHVRSFEFDKEGGYSPGEVEALRKQLAGPGWSCLVEVRSRRSGGENADVCLRQEGGKILGLAIIANDPRKLTVVNILGNIDLEQLRDLEGHLGIPRLGLKKEPTATRTPP